MVGSAETGSPLRGTHSSLREDFKSQGEAKVGSQLSSAQSQELCDLLRRFKVVFQTLPGHTTLAEHRIQTEGGVPVHLPPYRIPQAFQETVHSELKEMLDHGIIE